MSVGELDGRIKFVSAEAERGVAGLGERRIASRL
jgi:uncharacterized small protein (DUF1192 family)